MTEIKYIDGKTYSNDFERVKKFLRNNPDKTLNVYQNINGTGPGWILTPNSFKLNFLCWSDDLFKGNFFYKVRDFEILKIQTDLEKPEEIPELEVIRIAVKNKLTRLIYPGKYVLSIVNKIDSKMTVHSSNVYHILKDNREFKTVLGIKNPQNLFPEFSNKVHELKHVSCVYDTFQEFKEGDYLIRKSLFPEQLEWFLYIVSCEKVER